MIATQVGIVWLMPAKMALMVLLVQERMTPPAIVAFIVSTVPAAQERMGSHVLINTIAKVLTV